jgi:hypothetical protein
MSTCSVAPQSPTVNGATATSVTVSVTKTAGSTAVPISHQRPPMPWRQPWFAWPGLVACLSFLILGKRHTFRPSNSKRSFSRRVPKAQMRWKVESTAALVVLLSLAALALPSCGGGGGGGGGGTASTPAGTYTLTVTGTSGSGAGALSHNVTLTMTVN